MKILVLGAGRMGSAAVSDMLKNRHLQKIVVADSDEQKLKELSEKWNDPRLSVVPLNVEDRVKTFETMSGVDALLSAVTYKQNLHLSRLAIDAGTHFCDLGGNDTIVSKELKLDPDAKKKGVTLIPDCGLAPGIVSIIAAEGIAEFERVESVQIRVGGLPQHPDNPLKYGLVFSVSGLINEYVEPTRILKNGRLTLVDSMTGLETLTFPEPFGELEAFYTSGGISTLPLTFADKVQNLDYKTIRYPGHCEKFKMMLDLGLAGEDWVTTPAGKVQTRPLFEKLLENYLPKIRKDAVLVRVNVRGSVGKDQLEKTYQIIDFHDPKEELTAMMRMTAIPASIITQMLAGGKIPEKGAVPQEISVPRSLFFKELEGRKIKIVKMSRRRA